MNISFNFFSLVSFFVSLPRVSLFSISVAVDNFKVVCVLYLCVEAWPSIVVELDCSRIIVFVYLSSSVTIKKN